MTLKLASAAYELNAMPEERAQANYFRHFLFSY